MMFHKKEKEDISDIKHAISEPAEQASDGIGIDAAEYEEMPRMTGPREAPLFVKLERYSDVISLIQEMKVFVGGIKNLFNILQELENLRIDAIKIMKATMQRLERRMIEMDNELLRPRGFEAPEAPVVETEVTHVEDSLTDLQQELAKLRKELEGLK